MSSLSQGLEGLEGFLSNLDFSRACVTREAFTGMLRSRIGTATHQTPQGPGPHPPPLSAQSFTVTVLYYPRLESQRLKSKLRALLVDSRSKGAGSACSGALAYSGKKAWYVIQGDSPAVSRLCRKAMQTSDAYAGTNSSSLKFDHSFNELEGERKTESSLARANRSESCLRLATFTASEAIVEEGFKVYHRVGNTGRQALDRVLWWLRHPERR